MFGPRFNRARARTALAAVALAATACATSPADTFLPPSRPSDFSLVGVPWGIAADSVTRLIEPRGYNFNRVDEDGDMWFDGMLFQAPTRVFAFMGTQKLVKFRVVILTADEDAFAVYDKARAELSKQFGAPKETIEQYQPPYRKGDNKAQEAVREGKATVETYWLPQRPAGMTHVAVSISNDLVVVVDYEGPAWERESLRRRKSEGR